MPTDEKTDAASPKRQAIRMMARTMWLREFKESNPDADNSETGEAWQKVRSDWIKNVTAAIRAIERNGFTISSIDEES